MFLRPSFFYHFNIYISVINSTLINIAYAEDQVATRKGIISLLENEGGLKVSIEADNGRQLITQLEKAKEVPDICILDIGMPELNGFDTLIELKKKWPKIKVLVLTIYCNDIYIIRMITNGANGYMLKTSHPLEIIEALHSIYKNGMYFSEVVTSYYFHAIQNKKLRVPEFTDKETQVLKYSCSDLSYEDIALKMHTTKRSVEGYRDSLFKKLNVNSRVSLVMFAIQFGLVPIETNPYYY